MTLSRSVKTVFLAVGIFVALINHSKSNQAQKLQTLSNANGCFSCVEAEFEKVRGEKGLIRGFGSIGATMPRVQEADHHSEDMLM